MNPQRMLYIVGAIHSLKKLYEKFWDCHYLKKKPKTTWFCIFMLVSLILWYDFERLRKSGLFRYRPCLSFLFLTYERHKYQHLTVIPIFLRQWHFSQKKPKSASLIAKDNMVCISMLLSLILQYDFDRSYNLLTENNLIVIPIYLRQRHFFCWCLTSKNPSRPS